MENFIEREQVTGSRGRGNVAVSSFKTRSASERKWAVVKKQLKGFISRVVALREEDSAFRAPRHAEGGHGVKPEKQ